MLNYKGKNIVVLGLGLSGTTSAEFLLKKGAHVTAFDQKKITQLDDKAKQLLDLGLVFSQGEPHEEFLAKTDLIVISPGISVDKPFFAKTKAPIIGEMELGFLNTKAPILAVTGSNGKTTSTSLCADILKKSGKKVFTGGNIGEPLISLALSEQDVDYCVLELSSFQLETVYKFKALGAAILNISPDHLDRHGTMENYAQIKKNIFINQSSDDWAVINIDDPYLSDLETKAEKISFSLQQTLNNGLFIADGKIKIALNNKIVAEKPWEMFKLWGLHNQENVMAAVALALKAKVDPQKALDFAADFSGLAHRIELVGEFNGVKYYDDSKGTNVGAVIKALDNFQEPVVLIAGGRDKGLDFQALYNPIKEKVKTLILIGEAQEKMEKILAKATKTMGAKSMAEAVKLAKENASSGEIVLLSPACASFDMFKSYEERGRVFAQEVKNQAGII